MTKKISLSIAFLLLGFVSVFAQVARVWGTVADSTTTQKLSAVNVQLVGGKTYSTVTSLQGTFAFSAIPHGSYTLVLSSVGYNGYSKSITVSADMDLSILLSEQVIPLGEVVVSSLRVNQKLKEVAAPMAIVGRTQIDASSAVTISNVLQNEPGLSLSGDGVWS
ncbi:MAG TPA: carboxypeptidase-like regulatory domain-containing protein, partial [Tenuifilaceae bacterium]|nr:carboxypeptidase-like regulatory domain-containing protein [Tenuifilaceae bacterium]